MITGGTGSSGNTVLKHFFDKRYRWDTHFLPWWKEAGRNAPRFAGAFLRVRKKVIFFIGNVRNAQPIKNTMWGADYVFHATALKQVPSCEFFPIEAKDNMLHAAMRYGVKRVVCLSTDKAASHQHHGHLQGDDGIRYYMPAFGVTSYLLCGLIAVCRNKYRKKHWNRGLALTRLYEFWTVPFFLRKNVEQVDTNMVW